jgi:S1-C subfamily serine protease
VLTVNYVVTGASSIRATLADGRTVVAGIVRQDFASGLALLEVPGGGHHCATLRASADLSPGEEVFLLASSGDEGPRVATGGVSAIGPFDAYWEYSLERAIMATVASPGVGGGPMLDRQGRMVGTVALNLNEVGRLSLAIPVDHYLERREAWLRGERSPAAGRAWVGLFCHTLHDHVVILGVLPGSPGEAAGLRSGDVVLAVDGVPVSDRRSLYRLLWRRRSGERLVFEVFRQDEVRTLEVEASSVEEMFE